MTFRNPILGAGGSTLLRPAIQSPNYVPGTQGWAIKRDGSAELLDLLVRGVFEGTQYVQNADGSFYYDGAPAAGNLIASIAAASGTDAYGNLYQGGIATYAGTEMVALTTGNLLLGDVADPVHAGLVGVVGAEGVGMSSPWAAAHPDTADVTVIYGDSTVTPLSAPGYPHIETSGTVWAADPVVFATHPGNVWAAETWHTPAFSGTWSATSTLNGNTGFQGLQYRKDAEDNVWLSGGATTTGAGGSIFTLPPGYFNPNKRHLVPCWIFDSSAGTTTAGFTQVTETGVVNIAATLTGITIAAGDQVYLNGRFPLGNLA